MCLLVRKHRELTENDADVVAMGLFDRLPELEF
jgi:hypothetical protein